MTRSERARGPAWNRQLTIRARLTLSYAGLVTGCGAVLIALVYLYMRFVPNYQVLGYGAELSSEVAGYVEASGPTGGIEIATADDFLDNLLIASGVALVVLAALSGWIGWIVAGRIIRPLTEISGAARRAATGSLDHRIALSGPRDEIRDVADTIDDMLASLERSFTAHQRFAANASHELRSPLATTKTMIDVTLDDPDADEAELRALAERIREVNHSSIETVDALLDLAAADQSDHERQPVDLAEAARAAVDEIAAEAAALDIVIDGPTGRATTVGNAVLIQRAVSNLLRNAVRHNHAGGRATVQVSTDRSRSRVTVMNTGAVIDPADIELLAEPFSRGSGRALTRGNGHGLGLAIVAAVVHAHGGALMLTPDPGGGLTVTMELVHGAWSA